MSLLKLAGGTFALLLALTVVPAVPALASDSGAEFAVGPPMLTARMAHKAISLPDGRVVLFGGHEPGFIASSKAEAWSPSPSPLGSFAALTMIGSHDQSAIAKLTDGRYLLAGGFGDSGSTPAYQTVEIYNPADDSFVGTLPLLFPRGMFGAATLTNGSNNGKVLMAGGWYDISAATYGEVYDPATGSSVPTGPLSIPRANATVLPANDGGAVVLSGFAPYGGNPWYDEVEVYNADTNDFTVLRSSLFIGESGWIVVPSSRPVNTQRLSDGRYLLVATKSDFSTQTLFTFDPETKSIIKVGTCPALPGSAASFYVYDQPLVDLTLGRAYLLGFVGGSWSQQRVYTLELSAPSDFTFSLLSNPAGSSPVGGYLTNQSGVVLTQDGRLFVTGGMSSPSNYAAVADTLLVTPVAAATSYCVTPPPTLASAASRKVHGSVGSFDLPLSLAAGAPTTEPRSGGVGGTHTIVFTFDKAVTDGTASVAEGLATAGIPTFSGNEMIVPLTSATNQQYVTVAVSNVAATDGGTGGSGLVRLGLLLGDVNQNRAVTLSDLGQVNAQIAQFVTTVNYLKDVNASGTLSLADKGIANTQITKVLPPP